MPTLFTPLPPASRIAPRPKSRPALSQCLCLRKRRDMPRAPSPQTPYSSLAATELDAQREAARAVLHHHCYCTCNVVLDGLCASAVLPVCTVHCWTCCRTSATLRPVVGCKPHTPAHMTSTQHRPCPKPIVNLTAPAPLPSLSVVLFAACPVLPLPSPFHPHHPHHPHHSTHPSHDDDAARYRPSLQLVP